MTLRKAATAVVPLSSHAAMLLGTCALLAVIGTPALAQSETAPPAAATDSGEVEEIVVTAQKRAQNVQNVPISITALSNEQLQAAGIAGTADLRVAVPALNVTQAVGGFGLPRIRGIGATGQGVGIENPVAVYVDGVYYSAAFGVLQSLFDTEQVAVLKGPQGTLFGRNTTGGVIQISTLAPSFNFRAKGEVGYSNYDTVNAGGFVTGPLSDTVAISVSGQYEDRNKGFGTNLFTGNDVQDGKQWVGRAKLLYKGADTSVLFSADFNGRRATEPAFRNFALNTAGNNVTNTIVSRGGDPERDIYSDIDPYLKAKQWGASVTIDHDFGAAKLKSITAYRDTKLFTFFDPDGTIPGETPAVIPVGYTPPQQLAIGNNYRDQQFTQEFNLVSDGSGPFQWVIGAFYMNDIGTTSPRPTWTRTKFAGNYTDTLADSRLDSYAGFIEGSYAITPATHFTAGVRYTEDHRDLTVNQATYCAVVAAPTCTTPLIGSTVSTAPVVASRKFDKVTWKVSLDHRFSEQLLAYASYNRGFRSGTFIPQAVPLITLQPEVVDAFEAGIKTDLFDRRVRFNLAGYYYDQKNVQVMQVIAGVQQVYNGKGAHIYGIDGDVTVRITNNFRLFGGFNYTHARYTSFTDAILSLPYPLAATTPPFSTTQFSYVDSVTGQTVANTVCLGTFLPPTITTQAARDAFYRARLGGNCLIRGDASGNRLQNTPTFTGSVGGSLDIPTSAGKFTIAGNFYHNSGFVGSPDERVKQESYETLDASLTWRAPNNKFYARVWGRNLTDQWYLTQIGASNSGDNGTNGPPRTYGATIGFDF